MKKAFAFIGILFILFIALVYWSASSTKDEFRTSEIRNIEDLENTDFREFDSVLVAASTLYEGGNIKTLVQGENYRRAWATPVKLPIVFLDTLKGGMKVEEEGGGKQTHSLKVRSSDGTLYTLRSITKDPKKLIPDVARTLGLENIIVDGISGQHPYGAVLAAELADKAGILHTHPQAVFLPKQPRLGELNEKYGNRIFLLEYETEGEKNWTQLPDGKEILETDDLQELKLEKGQMLQIDKNALVRVRLFDILIGDWDRHAEQWGWVIRDKGDQLLAVPLAGDRDNAFFKLGGLVPNILTNKHIEPLIRPFEKEVDYMPGLVYPFDRYFLYNTPKEIYLEQAKQLQRALDDATLENAFKVWPDDIARLDKKEILDKLKTRRDNLVEHAAEFHKILQEKGPLDEKLKGSEDLELTPGLVRCFDC